MKLNKGYKLSFNGNKVDINKISGIVDEYVNKNYQGNRQFYGK